MQTVLTSTIVDRQLPDFVRSEHPKFVTFLKKYYEWLEENDQVNYEIERLKESIDVDDANSYYLNLLKRDLLPYFPENILADKRLFLKLVNQFYKSNGTPDSIKFLFRALFNDNIDIYYPKDDVLRASDGKWKLPLALRVETEDVNIFNIEQTRITGSISKATAIVEKVSEKSDSRLGINYIEIYISHVERDFQTGEIISALYIDETTNLNVTVTARIVGELSEITIDPNNRGLYYVGYDPTTSSYPGDPVTIIGGLNPSARNPVRALAYVGETTKGEVTDVFTKNGGFGFRKESEISSIYNDKVTILDFSGGFDNSPIGTEATARINLLDDNTVRLVNVSNMQIETLNAAYSNINVANSITISNITTYQTFNVYPIAFVELTGGGGKYVARPSLETYSLFNEDKNDILVASSVNLVKDTVRIVNANTSENFITSGLEAGSYIRLYKENPNYESILRVQNSTANTLTFSTVFPNDVTNLKLYKLLRNNLYNVGSIGRISILNPGLGYANGETIIFTGGSGYGANAYINVNSSGSIVSVTVNAHSSNAYVLGGEGYRKDSIPTITVDTVSGTNAILQVAEVLGDGEQYDLLTSKIGAISTIRVVNYGYDYIDTPIISLRNIDIVVSNITSGQLFVSNTIVYQGTSNSNFTFKATVDTYNSVTNILRVFNYSGTLNDTLKMKHDSSEELEAITSDVISWTIYGDGRAKANAVFQNGLIRYPGIYVNNDGHLSSDKYLQDGDKYHDFSYELKTDIDYVKFKKPLGEISHPVGLKTFATRIVDIEDSAEITDDIQYIIINDLPDSYNVTYGANSVVTTNTNADLTEFVNVGDIIILKNVYRAVSNTVNVTSDSNIVYGQNTNFINDIQEGEIIYLGTGNTEIVLEISNSNYLLTQNTIGITQTGVTINVVFDEVKTVTFVNANTVLVDTNFSCISNNFTTAIIQKVE